jgi:hypothetical protein
MPFYICIYDEMRLHRAGSNALLKITFLYGTNFCNVNGMKGAPSEYASREYHILRGLEIELQNG